MFVRAVDGLYQRVLRLSRESSSIQAVLADGLRVRDWAPAGTPKSVIGASSEPVP